VGRHFIDKDGACWDAEARQLEERFGARCSSATFEKFIVRNLGFVSVQFGGTSCLIKVAPSKLSLEAFMTLSQLLLDVAADRYAVSLFQDGWRDLIFPDCRAVLRHLLQSSDCGRRGRGDPFATRPKAISKLPSAHPLTDLIDAWRAGSGRLDVTTCSSLLNERLGGRFVVIEQAPDASGLVFSRIGQGYAMYDPGWATRMVGYPIDCQPDAKYGQWIARCLRSAFETRDPTLHDVDAIVANPVARTARRIRYTRLTLPLRRRDDGLQMLSASLVDTGINVGVKLG
jgi:hypothetical protein